VNNIVIVGSGLFGLTMANLIVEEFGIPVTILERRNHIGGNAWSHIDEETGIEIHDYGSHIFHTSNEKVIQFITKFGEFTQYKHTVWAKVDSNFYSMPFNLQTISAMYSKAMSPDEARSLLSDEISKSGVTEEMSHQNLENKAIYSVGQKLYEKLVLGYTKKQWQTDPKNLPASIISRIPVRFNFDNSYFKDSFQGIPKNGYCKLLENMANHELINIQTNIDYFKTDYFSLRDNFVTVYTGPIDRFFEYRHGRLGWRTLDFEIEKLNVQDFQGTSVVNYPSIEVPWTRIHEFKHLRPERNHEQNQTIIMKEFSRFAEHGDEPYYPINDLSDRETLLKYRVEISKQDKVHFGGRLGSYQYLDMHMAIASAISMFDSYISPKLLDLKKQE
jgi:UDP-galactopyranose mutase